MTYLKNEWSDPVLIHKGPSSGIMEDFAVLEEGEFKTRYRAYFTSGPEWWNQHLYTAVSENPLGPFERVTKIKEGKHIRVEKAVIGPGEWYGTAVYRRLPKTGIWHHENRNIGTVRTLLIPPVEGTKYSVSAANPCLFRDLIFFEGRDDIILWRIFQADLDGNVCKDPIRMGGNPFVTQFGDTIYLYFSKYRPQKGFDTWCITQPA